jgi:hypothetical protein
MCPILLCSHHVRPTCDALARDSVPPKTQSLLLQINDISLEDYISTKRGAVYQPHTAGRYQKKRFRKAQCPIVERYGRLAACSACSVYCAPRVGAYQKGNGINVGTSFSAVRSPKRRMLRLDTNFTSQWSSLPMLCMD